jgi:hypothetical protein
MIVSPLPKKTPDFIALALVVALALALVVYIFR